MPPRTARPTAAPPSAAPRESRAEALDDCAAAVLDTVPAVMDTLRQAMRRHVGDEMSVPQFRGLNFVAKHPACSIGEVAAFLGVTMPTASAMVERMTRAGLVETRADAADRRRSPLHITTAGSAQLRRIRSGAHEDLTQALAACSPEELATLEAGLQLIRRVL
jgi:DNA-binding MarR family transcriptional regulator